MTSSGDDWLDDTWEAYDRDNVIAPKVWTTSEPGEKEIITPPFPILQALDFTDAEIPPRPWIVPGLLMRGAMTLLVGTGGAGKSLFSLQISLAISAGQDFGGFSPRRQARVLVINQEDDAVEQRRRLAAIRQKMAITASQVEDRLLIPRETQDIIATVTDPKTKTQHISEVVRKLALYIQDNQIDVIVIDPLAETMQGSENDVEGVRGAMRIWRDSIAKACNCAVLLVHHTSKASSANAAGDANAARGSTAINAAVRSSWTVFPMSEDDAMALNIDIEDRHQYLRVDDAKANYGLLSGTARWFQKHEVQLENGSDDISGDKVGVLMPWTPPGAFDGIGTDTIKALIKEIAEAFTDGKPFKYGQGISRGTDRALIDLVMLKAKVEEQKAERMIKAWLKSGVLTKEQYHDDDARRSRKGINGKIGLVS